jgi:hypothetical protein
MIARTALGFRAGYANRVRGIARNRSIRPTDRLATASRTTGQNGSTGERLLPVVVRNQQDSA